jgi:patatin-like phospholipase
MKRILACDGGGIFALFTLQVLKRIEALFREERGRPGLLLRDEFDFFAGTSTGAIVATGLAWGMSVQQIEDLYVERAQEMFTPAFLPQRLRASYYMEPIANLFRAHFHEDDAAKTPALLGTDKLRAAGSLKYVLVVVRNASTGSAWPVSNNPVAMFNAVEDPECNLRIPIWQLLRASTAAPTYFPPETIELGGRPYLFLDGGITPFNNPALIAALMATLPEYRIGWEAGVDNLLLVSIGTGFERVVYKTTRASDLHLLHHVRHVSAALIASAVQEQDMVCRILGACRFGGQIDREIGDLLASKPGLLRPEEKKFAYVRYNRFFPATETEDMTERTGQRFALDNVALIPYLQTVGEEYARTSVRREHFFTEAAEAAR